LNGINEWNRVFAADVYFNNFTKQKIFKLGALFSILGKLRLMAHSWSFLAN